MEEKVFFNGCPAAGCHAFCALKAHVRDGILVKVESADYPQGLAQRSICLKGLASPRLVYHPERLKYPLKRVGERGSGQWKRISWDEALDSIAEKLLEIRGKYGPESLKVQAHGSSSVGTLGRFIGERFANVWGAGGEFESHGPVADGGPPSASLFYLGVSGQAHDVRDLASSNMVIVWGWNPAETRFPDMPAILDARDRGAKLVVVGPYFDATAARADQWIPVIVGGDAALALAMIHTIIENNVYDADYVAKYTVGPFLVREDNKQFLRKGVKYVVWDEATNAAVTLDATTKPALKGSFVVNGVNCKPAFQLLVERASEYAPEKSAKISGIPHEVVKKLAMEYARAKPAAIRWSPGMARTRMSNLGCRAVIVLGAITGNIGVRGGGVCGTAGGGIPSIGTANLAKRAGIVIAARAIEMPPGAPGKKTLPGSNSPMKGWSLIREGKPYPIKAIINTYQNRMHATYGNIKSELAILEQMDLMVATDILNTRTVQYADYSLPSCTVFEREDLQVSRNYILKMEKAIEPQYEARSDVEFWSELAKRVGLGEYFKYSTDEYINMLLDSGHPSVAGITLERLNKEKLIRANVPTEPSYSFPDKKFPTPTGRIEFYKERLLTFGEELPLHKDRYEDPIKSPLAKKYPLTFLSIKSRAFTHTLMATVDWMREVEPEPMLDMNPVDARKRKIKDGDMVQVINDRGTARLKARITEVVSPGTVNCDHGWWPEQFAEGHYSDLLHSADDLNVVNPSLTIEPIIGDKGCSAHLIYFDCLVEVKKA